ncbi:MAG: type IV toxin-antitoxin system AbiEi family antitoxin domain-containing protein [Kiritimatiellae bacterium]|nr:type IV toxin-antitoxin system AbiEi family antitoxin domain-containing protein [Kiritimatiellia bacterium]
MSGCQIRMNAKLKELFEREGVISVAGARSVGVSRAMLSHWVARGVLQRVAQGVYAPAEELPDELLVMAKRSASIVFSHETALVLHGLHNRIPAVPTFTIPTGLRMPRSLEGRAVGYHVRRAWHGIGRGMARSFQGHEVPCYDPERTICDVIRSRGRMDAETYTGALRKYAAWPGRNLPRLFRYAKEMDMEERVHGVMEVLA